MALTETQKLNIAKLLTTPGQMVTYTDVNNKVTDLGTDYVTAAVETQLTALLAEWLTIENDFAKFTATESNEGFNLDQESRKTRVRRDVATLLYFTELRFGGNGWAYNARA